MDNFEEIHRLREEYESSLDEAEARRNEYYRAIQKLNLSGVPLREIAESLGVSHQRVHQIVTGEAQVRSSKKRKLAQGGSAMLIAIVLVLAGAGIRSFGRVAPTPTANGVSQVRVPDVFGHAAVEAEQMLEQGSLCIGSIQATGSGQSLYTVTSQSPAAGSLVGRLTRVNVKLPGPTPTKVTLELLPNGHIPILSPPGSSSASIRLMFPSALCPGPIEVFGQAIDFTYFSPKHVSEITLLTGAGGSA
jgi:hypothetical protein